MQTGEVLRREVFNLLDAAKGGRLKKLKEVNKHEIVEGVTCLLYTSPSFQA